MKSKRQKIIRDLLPDITRQAFWIKWNPKELEQNLPSCNNKFINKTQIHLSRQERNRTDGIGIYYTQYNEKICF